MKVRLVAILLVAFVNASASTGESDPMHQLAKSLPHTIKYKNKGQTISFCPDNTCNEFVAARGVSSKDLSTFAYIYLYRFSGYAYLEEWRSLESTKKTADRLLAMPEYRGCAGSTFLDRARCVLMRLTENGRIKLRFVRYDEGGRAESFLDIPEELADPNP